MTVMPARFGELDRLLVEVSASNSLADIRAHVLGMNAVPLIQNVAYRWWRRAPLEQAPDWLVSSFGDRDGYAAPPIAGDTWATTAPQALWRQGPSERTMFVQIPLVGRRASLGVVTAQLAIEQGAWVVRRIDWTSRLLLLAVTLQEKAEDLLISPFSIRLAPREVECLGLAAKGLKAKQIASALGIGQQTVQFHLARARIKLSAANTVEAVARSVQLGIVRPPT